MGSKSLGIDKCWLLAAWLLKAPPRRRQRSRPTVCVVVLAASLLACVAEGIVGCGTTSSSSAQPAPPAIVSVSVSPSSASVFLGNTQQFEVTVTGIANTAVSWSVNGIAGGNSNLGTISASGLYTAPPILPSPSTVAIKAISLGDPTANGTASVSVMSDIVVAISPNSASLTTGESQEFFATFTSAGNPSTGVIWSVNGVSGGNSTFGTVAPIGADTALYTAPVVPPSPPTVTVKVTSVADSSRTASASVTITCATANSISPPTANVALGQSESFSASLCVLAGTAVTWDVNGILGGNSLLGTVTNTGATTTLYAAPGNLPISNPVTIHASAGGQSASASVTIVSSVVVTLSPPSATLGTNQRATFSANVTNTSNTAVTWAVNGIVNGNSLVGEICLLGSNPCAPPTSPTSGSVDYLAPGTTPSANPVTLTATSAADPSRSGIASVTISTTHPSVAITVSPPFAFVVPSGSTPSQFQFTSHVTGTTDTQVTWSVSSAVAGAGCTGAACGTVDSTGRYTAPSSAPSPNAIAVTAQSLADLTKSAQAVIAITSGPVIEQLLPSSVIAGVASSFTLAVEGLNFVAGSGSGASIILANSSPRNTVCQSSVRCTTTLQPGDVSVAGNLSIQVQNPGSASPLSNPVSLVVAPFDISEDVISLTTTSPTATGKNIVVVEPTTAGTTPSQINVDFFGLVTGGTTCNLQATAVTVTRPSSGSTSVSLCVHGNTLDPSFSYAFSGPEPSDIAVVPSSLGSLFPNLIQLDLTISSSTLPGLRTLFTTTANNDRGVATGMLEVK